MDNAKYDFNKLCRVCKQEAPEMQRVFVKDTNRDDYPRIDEMLMACSAVMVVLGDDLPDTICQKCNEQLIKAYEFKQLCEDTDMCLRDYLKQKDAEIKKEVSQYKNENDATDMPNNTEQSRENFGSPIKSEPEDQDDKQCSDNCDFIQFLEDNQVVLTCRACLKCFTTLDGLKCHKRLHTGGLFKCKECGKQYTRPNHLQRHELSHGRRKMHVCKICNKTLTRIEHLKRHLVTHLKEKPFSCTTCNRGFNRSEHLANHIKRCKGDRVHICDICNKGFNREDSLEVHKHLHENKVPNLPTLDNLDNIDEHYVEIDFEEPNQNDTFSNSESEPEAEVDGNMSDCLEPQVNISENMDAVKLMDIAEMASLEPFVSEDNEVYAELDSEELLEEKSNIEKEFYGNDHKDGEYICKEERDDSDSGHSEYLPTKSLTKFKRKRGRPRKNLISKVSGRPRGRPPLGKVKTEFLDENSFENEGEYPCPVCKKIFNKMNMLEKHAYKHDGLKIHTCGICSKQFSRSNHLKRHMLSHSEQKPFSCEICHKCFNRRDHLMQHIKLHSRPQDYECDICKKSFTQAVHLTKHKATKHNILRKKVMGEKKYQCTVCLKGFTTEKYRDVHMKGHMGDKKYQCRTCDKTFLSKSHLTEHAKFHNENCKKFLCSECGQRFIRNDYLVIHMRRHRGEKPFKCQYCGKGFPRTTDLTVHERYHTGEKTHLCTICGRGFGRAYNLTVHMRTHTGEKPYQCTYCDAAFAQGNDLKAHVRRHTGERFQCEHCTESFLMGYLLTQHKRTVHGLNVVSNIRRLQPVHKQNPDDPPPITIPLPTPVIPSSIFNSQIQAQLAVAQLHQQVTQP